MDDTKYANTQTTQIALISPGSTVCMYKNYIRKDESQTNIQKYIFVQMRSIIFQVHL